MAIEYFQGEYGLKFIAHQQKEVTKYIEKLLKGLSKETIRLGFVQVNNGKVTKTVTVKYPGIEWAKISEIAEQFVRIGAKRKNEQPGTQVDLSFGSVTLRLYKSGGRLKGVVDYQGNRKTSKKPSPPQQESGVMYLLNQGEIRPEEEINHHINFPFDQSWHKSFVASFKGIESFVGNLKNYETYLDSSNQKPKFLNLMTSSKVLPESKDNWNPADLWMIKKTYNGKDIEEVANGIINGTHNIQHLNELLEERFQSGDLIGVSLKKVNGNKATTKVVRVDVDAMKSIKLKRLMPNLKMSVSNSYIDIQYEIEVNGNTSEYMIRYRPRAASGQVKIYFEGKPIDRKTWDGAVSKSLLDKMYFKKGLSWLDKNIQLAKGASSVLSGAKAMGDQGFVDFLQRNNDYVDLQDIDKELNDYEIKRGIYLSYHVYMIDLLNNDKEFFRNCYIWANKLSETSSVHLKVF